MYSYPRKRRKLLTLESLESRDNPTGAVLATPSGTTLILTGDDDSNAIQLSESGGTITVTGLNGTAINGGTTFPGVTSIRASMNDGNDSIAIDTTASFVLSGSMIIDLGDGDNNVSLMTSQKVELGSLSVTAGDGQDIVSVEGGVSMASAIRGNVVISIGGGRNSNEPPYLDSEVLFRRADVLGIGGLRITAGEGPELLTLDTMRVSKALNASGGDGSLTIRTYDTTLGTATLSSIGREPGNPARGTDLVASNTIVQGLLTLKSGNGVNLDYTNGSTGSIMLTSGRYGFSTTNFYGNPAINGNITIRGYRHSLNAGPSSDVTVTGDLSMTATTYASLSTNDGTIKFRNINLIGTLGADFFGTGGATSVVTSGSVTMRARRVQFDQYTGSFTIGGGLTVNGFEEARFNIGQSYFGTPIAITTVTGPTLIQGRDVKYTQTESKATFTGGLTLQATDESLFESLPWQLDSHPDYPDYPPFGDGSQTTVGGKGLTIRGRMATYRQVEGTATISTVLAIQATEYALLESNPKELGTNSNGDDVWGLGSKITLTGGGLNMRGREVGYYQEEGEATFEKGVVLIATTNASFETSSDWVTDSPGTKVTIPGGGITVQGGSADLRFTDGTVDINGNVVVKGAEGASFGTDWYNADSGTAMTVHGSLSVDGGISDVMSNVYGEFLKVDGDVSIRGAGHGRIWFTDATGNHPVYGSVGTEIGGKLSISNLSPDHDWVDVDGNFQVGGDMLIALGNGANGIDFCTDDGTALLNGSLTISTGNGSDIVTIASTTIAGATVINTGAGADRVQLLANTVLNGAFSAEMGTGADRFEAGLPLLDMYNNIELPAGPVTFNAAAKVNLGVGNDSAALGIAGDPDGKVLFGASGTLAVDGGLNLDFFDRLAGQFDLLKVTDVNFEAP